MNGIEISDLTGIINAVRPDSPTREFEVVRNLQNHVFCDMFFNSKLRKKGSGPSIERMIVLEGNGNVEWRLPFQRSTTNVKQLMKPQRIGWVHLSNSWGMDVFEAMTMQGADPGQVMADELDARRIKCYEEMMDEKESKGWDTPDYADDPYGPLGFPYWICMGPVGFDDADPDFQGYTVRYGDGTTSTTRAGINGSTYDKYRNLCATYNGTINEAFVQTLADCFRLQSFAPITIPGGTAGAKDFNGKDNAQYELCMGNTPFRAIERYMRARYDEFRSDLDPQGGKIRFRQVPMTWVKKLDTATYDPIYGINKKKFRPTVMMGKGGRVLIESEPMTDPGQHTTVVTKVDEYFNLLGENPREFGFVIHTPIS